MNRIKKPEGGKGRIEDFRDIREDEIGRLEKAPVPARTVRQLFRQRIGSNGEESVLK